MGKANRQPAFVDAVTRCLRPPAPKGRPRPDAPVAMHDADGELPPGTMVGEYCLEGKVGQGAMGVVYGAVHPIIGKRAAIKIMRPLFGAGDDAVDRFHQEARAVGRLRHPNIVDAFGFGTLPDGRCYLAMEWLQGQSLGKLVRHGRFSIEYTVEIVDQICQALAAAHEGGIVHRDLKPDNVFLLDGFERPVVKLLDFSVAKLSDEVRQLTQTGVVIGTPAYVSPEQIRGAAVDGQADVYALGVMTFEMLVGALPFPTDEKMALLHMHLNEAAPLPSSLRRDVPQSLDALVSRMLAKQPDHRPPLREIRRVLSEVQFEAAVETAAREIVAPLPPPVSLAEPAPPEAAYETESRWVVYGRRRLLVVGVAAATALLFSVIVLGFDEASPFQVHDQIGATTPLSTFVNLLPQPMVPSQPVAPSPAVTLPEPRPVAAPSRLYDERPRIRQRQRQRPRQR